MKKPALFFALLGICGVAVADQYVSGYLKQNGTYVPPHYQTQPDQYKYNNYSSQGNSNPYTGQQGYQKNEFSNPPAYNQQKYNTNTYQQPKYNPRTGLYQ